MSIPPLIFIRLRPIFVKMSTATEIEIARREVRWNQLSNDMKMYHDHFLEEFDYALKFSDGSFSKITSLSGYLYRISQFIQHITNHHNVEESYFFPLLAKRMPEFGPNQNHKDAHKQIHAGLDKLLELVHKYRQDQTSYSPEEMKACLESFQDVLKRHLREEVESLKGENMKKYFTWEEYNKLPMH